MKQKIRTALQTPAVLPGLYVLATLVATVHLLLLGSKSFTGSDISTHYNNFIIFRNSFFHLIQNLDLYQLWPAEHYDLFKYSPTFALAMFPIAMLPPWAGLLLWNLCGTLLLFYAVKNFPFRNQHAAIFMLWVIFLEMITNVQSSQSNSMIAAFLLMAFTAFENKKVHLASLFIIITVFIKIFGVLAFLLFFFYPQKKKFILYSILWTALMVLVPLVVISPQQLIFLYESWLNLLQDDHSISNGLSVIGMIKSWFGVDVNKTAVTFTGLIMLVLPLIRINAYNNVVFRTLYLANVLIWVIIFNHRAESATFIIAVCGVALWYACQEHHPANIALLVAVLVFTCLSPSDLFPGVIRKEFFEPYVIKAVPCIAVWLVINYQLVFGRYTTGPANPV